MREIEIKLKVKDLGALERELIKRGCKLSDPIRQEDVIFSNRPNFFNNSKEGDIIPRIRKQGNVVQLNFKQQKSREMDNLEYEIKIDNANSAQKMLEMLGWNAQVEVKKTRKEGRLGEYTVCLDRVDGLGDFVELEKMTADDADVEKVRKELFDTMRVFGFSEKDEEEKGYDTQMYLLNNKR